MPPRQCIQSLEKRPVDFARFAGGLVRLPPMRELPRLSVTLHGARGLADRFCRSRIFRIGGMLILIGFDTRWEVTHCPQFSKDSNEDFLSQT